MAIKKRPVYFKTTKKMDGIYKEIEKQGLFHLWGVDSEEHDTNYGNFTVAIIEDEDGNVFTALPNEIKFLDK